MSNKTARETRREKRRQEQQRVLTRNLLIIAGVVLLIVAGIWYSSSRPVGDIVSITPREIPNANGRQMGNPDAPVVVEVFEDYQCPVCGDFTKNVEPQIIENYVKTGKVLFIYRFYPFIDDRVATKESDQAANASMCASEQGRFWDYHDILYANQNGENAGAFNNRRLQAFAENLGLNMDDFNNCFEESKYWDEIRQDLALGQTRTVQGTPTVFVNNQVLQGFTYPIVQAGIEAALASTP
ncbi:MAG TPA: DsbA family protein [Anaerolineales bacterium]|nr:DsbA family protein [Anaerolineales bacterium]